MLDDFVLRLGGPRLERTTTEEGWITAPVAVGGDGQWTPTSSPVIFAKLERVVEGPPEGRASITC